MTDHADGGTTDRTKSAEGMSAEGMSAEEQWRAATANGSFEALMGEVVEAASRSAGTLVLEGFRVARRAARATRQALDPLLVAIRSGTSLREDLLRMVSRLLDDPPIGDTTWSQPVPSSSEGHPSGAPSPEDLPPEMAELHDAIVQGVRRAAAAGEVDTPEGVEAIAWALTSLLMTLAMRSREGEDTAPLIAAATSAMEDLLGSADPSAAR